MFLSIYRDEFISIYLGVFMSLFLYIVVYNCIWACSYHSINLGGGHITILACSYLSIYIGVLISLYPSILVSFISLDLFWCVHITQSSWSRRITRSILVGSNRYLCGVISLSWWGCIILSRWRYMSISSYLGFISQSFMLLVVLYQNFSLFWHITINLSWYIHITIYISILAGSHHNLGLFIEIWLYAYLKVSISLYLTWCDHNNVTISWVNMTKYTSIYLLLFISINVSIYLGASISLYPWWRVHVTRPILVYSYHPV